MSLPFNIMSDLTLSYFVILFFNYLQGLHVLPYSINFFIFKNSFLLNHEDPHDVPHTTRNNTMYTIHPWVLYLHVHFPSCPNTFINLAIQNQWLGLTSMTTTNLPTECSRNVGFHGLGFQGKIFVHYVFDFSFTFLIKYFFLSFVRFSVEVFLIS